MQDQKPPIADSANDPSAAVRDLAEQAEKAVPGMTEQNDILGRVIDKIRGSENILVTLSRDPSVDEMAGALGLTMFLDGLQKHTTAIYSGKTPDALKFLQPEGTFENNTASLQDFIIALSKDKADHLRYKLEGDFVKIYITPYKTTLSEADLEFSRGDYNVDLVLAIAVPTAGDLDEALTEYGRIMHDATTVDITCGAPGRFGEIEWSDPGASSVSEMLTKLIFRMEGEDVTLEKEIANALLTGIVAATGRFSNERTNSETMQLAAKLMAMGADQQMIAMHVIDSEAEAKAAAEAEKQKEEEAAKAAEAAAVAKEAAKAADTSGTTVAVDEQVLAQAKARASMEAAAEAAVSQAVTMAANNAAAVGANGVGLEPQPAQYGASVNPVLPPVQMQPQMQPQPQTQLQTRGVAQEQKINPENPVLPTVGAAPTPMGEPMVTAPVMQPQPVVTMPVAQPQAVVAAPTMQSQSVVAPKLETMPNAVQTTAGPKNYEEMIEQALAEPLPVETAASAAGLLKTPVVQPTATKPEVATTTVATPQQTTVPQQTIMTEVPAGINPAVMAAPQEAAETAAPILGTMGLQPEPVTPAITTGVATAPAAPSMPVMAPTEVSTPTSSQAPTMPVEMAAPEMKPGQPILPPAPAPEVGTGMLPPVMPNAMTESNVPANGEATGGVMTPTMTTTPTMPMNPTTPTVPTTPATPTTPTTPGAFQIPGVQ